MKYIQLKYNGTGRRTVNLNTHGFMGPSKSPLGKGPLQVAGDYLRPGTLTTAFQLVIPPSGECQVVDCQHNREMLRKVTKDRDLWEDIKVYDEKSGQYKPDRKLITQKAGFTVIDATPIEEDIVLETTLAESSEIQKLKAEIAKLEAEKAGVKVEDLPVSPDATADGQNSIPMEDEPPAKTAEEIKADRFKNKMADPISLV